MATCRRPGTNRQITEYEGGGEDYAETELSNWEGDTDTDHEGDTETDVLQVYAEGGGGGLWDDAVTLGLAAGTNTVNYCRIIEPASGQGPSGVPIDDGTMAGFRVTSGSVFVFDETDSRVYDLALKANDDSSSNIFCINIDDGADRNIFAGVLMFDSANAGIKSATGIGTYNLAGTIYGINCLAYNIDGDGFSIDNGATAYLYNCNADGNGKGFDEADSTAAHAVNCIADNNGTNFGGDWDTKTDCLDGSSPTYENAPPDFHLASNDVTAKDQGTDLSGDGTFAFDDDINDGVMGAGKAGETRTGSWDIGFDEYVAVGAVAPTAALYGPLVGPMGGPI